MWPQNGGSCELFVSWASPPSVWKQETGSTSMLWDAGGQNFLSPDRGEYTAFNQRRKKRRERSVCSGFPTSLTASRQEAGGREGLLSSALSPLMWKQIWNSSASSTRELHSSSPLNNYFVDLNPWFCRKPHACVCAHSSVHSDHLWFCSICSALAVGCNISTIPHKKAANEEQGCVFSCDGAHVTWLTDNICIPNPIPARTSPWVWIRSGREKAPDPEDLMSPVWKRR